MRLLTKQNIYFFSIILVVFTAGGYLFYFELQDIMNEEAVEKLHVKKEEVISYISKQNKLPESISKQGEIIFVPAETKVATRLIDTMVYLTTEGETLPFKQLHFGIQVDGKNYKVIVSKAMLESDDLIETITSTFIIIALILIAILLMANYAFSKLTWKPFFGIINTMSTYETNSHAIIEAKTTGTKEFDSLYKAVHTMTERIKTDFITLRSFTENASHELQTPLAIIQNKIEQLLQETGLTDKQRKELFEINRSVGKLSKLNQTLLLFAKIENQQFVTKGKVDLSKIVNAKLEQFEDLMGMKHFDLKKEIQPDIFITIHPELADIVISNLLLNAIKYSKENTVMKVELNKDGFMVCNEGEPFGVDGNKLFERFFKLEQGSGSTGLGLALVKQIAVLNDHIVEYGFSKNMHIFKYIF